MQPLALHDEFELALGESGVHILKAAFRRPKPAIPKLHRSAAILPLGYRALEIAVGQGMVLHLHRQTLIAGVERGAPGHGPGPEGAVPLQSKIEVQARGRMLLDDEPQALRGRDRVILAGRLGGVLEIAHLLVAGESGCRHERPCRRGGFANQRTEAASRSNQTAGANKFALSPLSRRAMSLAIGLDW